mmetsp:Transcript_18794/g.33758  ORF Transcript_18794/g.33758 Transcript_18794/m.33758 type:complete len:162 (+) Transcript_18794:39-524(+)
MWQLYLPIAKNDAGEACLRLSGCHTSVLEGCVLHTHTEPMVAAMILCQRDRASGSTHSQRACPCHHHSVLDQANVEHYILAAGDISSFAQRWATYSFSLNIGGTSIICCLRSSRFDNEHSSNILSTTAAPNLWVTRSSIGDESKALTMTSWLISAHFKMTL